MDDLKLRGVEEVIGGDELERDLRAGKKLRLKLGVDPTRPDLHLGHAVVLQILRRFQEAGHTVIFLIGDGTTRIGDPSGRDTTRPILTQEEIDANAQTYLEQVGKVLDLDKVEVRHNAEWFDKLEFVDVLKLAGKFSVAQLIEREDFRNRLDAGQELGLHELLYPVMQAYDSVALKADIELGGTDQRFNILAGRALQKKMDQRPQQIILAKLLVGTDGEKKMSKSLDNYIGLTDAPLDMYGKVMSIPDKLIAPYYELCTAIPLETITELVKTLAAGANPRDAKASLAREIVRIYHGEAEALAAEDSWNATFRDKTGPTEEQIVELHGTAGTIAEVLVASGEFASNSEIRRLIEQNGVRINSAVADSLDTPVAVGDLIQVGKRRFYKLSDSK